MFGSRRPVRRLGPRRLGTLGLAAALALGTVSGCSVTAGSAVLIDGQAVPEASVQHDTAVFLQENSNQAVTAVQTAAVNRAQITFQVRHALIAKALAASRITITDDELASAQAQVQAQGSTTSLAAQLDLPSTRDSDVLHDLVAVDALVKALPAAGTPVTDVSVTAEAVPATSRDQAVALRSQYLAHPATMDAAVTAAGSNGVPKKVYRLVETPQPGADGLYLRSTGSVLIIPNADSYLVLRATGRSVAQTTLTQTQFSSVQNLTGLFDLAALLLAPYEGSAGISVNPRYGEWDPASLQVVPGNDGL